MFDSIQSVRVMGVVDSFLMMPFCRSSVLKLPAPDRVAVINDIAMMPGTKNSMNRYFLLRMDVSAALMNGDFPVILWFISANTEFRICIFVDTEAELGSYMYLMETEALASPDSIRC